MICAAILTLVGCKPAPDPEEVAAKEERASQQAIMEAANQAVAVPVVESVAVAPEEPAEPEGPEEKASVAEYGGCRLYSDYVNGDRIYIVENVRRSDQCSIAVGR